MPMYRVYRMKDAPRQQFRWAPHVAGAAAVKAKDYEPDGEVQADSEYHVWSNLRASERPLAVGDSRGSQFDRLFKRNGKILIPVNGTDVSRRAAEVGFTLARANDAQVTVLYVTRAPSTADRRGGLDPEPSAHGTRRPSLHRPRKALYRLPP